MTTYDMGHGHGGCVITFNDCKLGESWQERLEALCERFSDRGAGADLTALSGGDQWGLYLHLSRLAGN